MMNQHGCNMHIHYLGLGIDEMVVTVVVRLILGLSWFVRLDRNSMALGGANLIIGEIVAV